MIDLAKFFGIEGAEDMSKITINPLLMTVVAVSLVACGGGGGDSTPTTTVAPVVTPTTPVLATEEAIAVKDNPSVYAAEKSEVIKATVTTTDTDTWTFADVNNDTDDSDAFVPEVDGHGRDHRATFYGGGVEGRRVQ